ncbi:MAG: AAC(3) family N-acetyltransferase [Paludibacter sp.]
MIINKLLYKILPRKTFSKIRFKFYTYRQNLYKPITEEKLRKILIHKLGIKNGSVVFIHCSMDFLNTEVPAERILDILLETVGPEGTLVFPCWHFNYRAEIYLQKDKVFDIKNSRTVMGVLPEIARHHPKAFRSIHPTTSILAIGKHAEELIQDHQKSIYPCAEMSPYYKMMKYDASIVGLGVTCHFLSFIHCPEDVLKDKFPLKTRTDEVFAGKVKLWDDSVITVDTLAAHSNITNRDLPTFVRKYLNKATFTQFSVRGSNFFRADSKLLFKRVVELAEKGITIYKR